MPPQLLRAEDDEPLASPGSKPAGPPWLREDSGATTPRRSTSSTDAAVVTADMLGLGKGATGDSGRWWGDAGECNGGEHDAKRASHSCRHAVTFYSSTWRGGVVLDRAAGWALYLMIGHELPGLLVCVCVRFEARATH